MTDTPPMPHGSKRNRTLQYMTKNITAYIVNFCVKMMDCKGSLHEEFDKCSSIMVQRLIVIVSDKGLNLNQYCLETFETAKNSRERWCFQESNPGPLA